MVIGACNALCLNIFENLANAFKLPFRTFPKRIRVYNYNDLIEKTDKAGFCTPDTKLVLKAELPFEMRSIFFHEHNFSFAQIDELAEENYSKGLTSSSHFLSSFIHEWMHSFHLDWIYRKFGYEGKCPYGKKLYCKSSNNIGLKVVQKMQQAQYSPGEREEIARILGKYAADSNSTLEITAEAYTKIICDSLSEKTVLPQFNPLKNYSKNLNG